MSSRAQKDRINPPRSPRYEGDIVVSGMSGRFPECESVEEFKDALYNGENLIREANGKWPTGYRGVVNRMGKLKNLGHLDAAYFGIHSKLANRMDPQLRILLEATHEALLDAGVNPTSMRGTNTAVYISVNDSEAMKLWSRNLDHADGYAMLGCHAAMMANRISHAFDFCGPSCAINTACSGSIHALDFAYKAIRNNDCDAAIVGASNVILTPSTSLYLTLLNVLDPEGQSKPLDDTARGYVRAESVVVVFLQKSVDANRIYARILGVKTNADGYKEEGIMFPSGVMQSKVMRELYAEIDLDPARVSYVETHTSGTKLGDSQECNCVVDTFCRNRQGPLLIGCVKSHMGHAELASGLCSLVKVLLAMEIGIIPANLKFQTPNSDIPGLFNGKLRVAFENEPCKGDIMAINSFGFGGTNSHVVLEINRKSKADHTTRVTIPRIVGVSGRTEDAVHHFLDNIELNKNDEEFLALLHKIHSSDIRGHNVRGFTILNDKTVKQAGTFGSQDRPVWFIYSGFGTQWVGMARDLMIFDEFRNSLLRSATILRPRGIDLEYTVTQGDDIALDDVLNATVSITAMQVALTDLLTSLDICPVGIIGHSAGEIAAAYADGSLTAEQAVLIAYVRGYALKNTALPEGSMAAVELSWEEATQRCPPGVYPVCDNTEDNVTVAGPPEGVRELLKEISQEGRFARAIRTAGCAFHSEYISDSTSLYMKLAANVIPEPKTRSSRWISSSIPESQWNSSLAEFASAEYFVNNSVSPVFFRQAMRHVPDDAIVVEVAPTGALQSILKSVTGAKTTNISLLRRGHVDNVGFFLSALGQLYIAGTQPKFSVLYEPVVFPVSRGTTRIASMVKWDHSIEWDVPKHTDKRSEGEITVKIDLKEEAFYIGHKVDGNILFPAAGYLVCVWKAYANILQRNYDETPVIFEEVKLIGTTVLSYDTTIEFTISILEGTGVFELRESNTVVVTGRIYVAEQLPKVNVPAPPETSDKELVMKTPDVYKKLRLMGYIYSGLFCGIIEADCERRFGRLRWNQNWVTFIDTMIQMELLCEDTRNLYMAVRLHRLSIDPKQHAQVVSSCDEHIGIPVYHDASLGVTTSGGINLRKMEYVIGHSRRNTKDEHRIAKYQFVPFDNKVPSSSNEAKSKASALNIVSQIIADNISGQSKMKVLEFSDDPSGKYHLFPEIKEMLERNTIPVVEGTTMTVKLESDGYDLKESHNTIVLNELPRWHIEYRANLIIVFAALPAVKFEILSNVVKLLAPGGFILLHDNNNHPNNTKLFRIGLATVAVQVSQSKIFRLLKKPIDPSIDAPAIRIQGNDFSWVELLKKAMVTGDNGSNRIYLYAENEITNGIMGLVNSLRREPYSEGIRSFFIRDNKETKFSIHSYTEQSKKDLIQNVLEQGVWGCYCHIDFDNDDEFFGRETPFAYVDVLTPGDMTSVQWLQGPPTASSNAEDPNEEEIAVYYASCNFRTDVMFAIAQLVPCTSDSDRLVSEFSGRDKAGRRVMGLNFSHSVATTVVTSPEHLLEVPEEWSLREAATVPMAYAVCYYALIIKGKMQFRDSILVHDGSGAVGFAAISIALNMNCTVFTTVRKQAQRDFLKNKFPHLKEGNIGSSNDASFEELVLTRTNGSGVHLVLNCLSGDLIRASLRCLSQGGRFLELGMNNFVNDLPLSMNMFLKNRSFHSISLLDPFFIEHEYQNVLKMVKTGIASGQVKPLPSVVFNDDQIGEAFRLFASTNHVGKVLVKLRNEESVMYCPPRQKTIIAMPRTYLHKMKTYIIIGGLGGFGMELANWLVERGAKNIILTSRSGVTTGYQHACIKRWRKSDINVVISNKDAANEESARQILLDAAKVAPIGGIFNLAFTLHDALMENQTKQNFLTVCAPKVNVCRNLDIASQELAPELDHFVSFSSIVSAKGNIGQSNYGFANSTVERICEERQKSSLPGLAIQWGVIGDVGYVAERMGLLEAEISGTKPQRISSCLATLDLFLQQSNPVVTSIVLPDRDEVTEPTRARNLIETVTEVVGIKDTTAISNSATLVDIGMDSLMTTEIKQILERNYNIKLSAKEIRHLTIPQMLALNNDIPTS